MFGLFKKGSDDDSALVKQALSPQTVAVVSASCCVRGTADIDAAAQAAAHAALQSAHLDWPVVTVTVTQAQSALGRISGELDSGGAKVAQQVSELFMSHGLSAFPVLIVNQRLVSYGGAPDQELVGKALPGSSTSTSQVLH
ncbi:hypothetical protein N8I74_02360 [Chitiniphilus purpureus]|uniref:Thioredoxin-like fold domain-containing protein n=1 Tax=Chitiniphilus purpureus TaxID=2981137 RepID=A0ABY6DND2_9NEIS|nr:hypothetical protein [Chitiniphilus sp. CD1]UXY15880.1 hypothetical protein N8I74_02360 [Chitiniphilus sp. CD1]